MSANVADRDTVVDTDAHYVTEFDDLTAYVDEADPGEVGERTKETLTEDEHVAVCPWHGWTYDLRTGLHTGDDSVSLPTFDVVVEDGVVYVEG